MFRNRSFNLYFFGFIGVALLGAAIYLSVRDFNQERAAAYQQTVAAATDTGHGDGSLIEGTAGRGVKNQPPVIGYFSIWPTYLTVNSPIYIYTYAYDPECKKLFINLSSSSRTIINTTSQANCKSVLYVTSEATKTGKEVFSLIVRDDRGLTATRKVSVYIGSGYVPPQPVRHEEFNPLAIPPEVLSQPPVEVPAVPLPPEN